MNNFRNSIRLSKVNFQAGRRKDFPERRVSFRADKRAFILRKGSRAVHRAVNFLGVL